MSEFFDSRVDTYEHISRVRGLLLSVVQDILRCSHEHDASKLVEPEKSAYDRAVPLLRDAIYGSPEYEAAAANLGSALEHHQRLNRHHPEHFPEGIVGMTLIDLLEMCCDWEAAANRKGEHAADSLDVSVRRYEIPLPLARVLENTLRHLRRRTKRTPMASDLEKRLRGVDDGHITVYELEKVRPLCREAADVLAAVRKWAEETRGRTLDLTDEHDYTMDGPYGDGLHTAAVDVLRILDRSDTDE